MRIKSIHLRDCYGHRDTFVDLSDTEAATIIGNNGAGKSTLFVDGPLFALYGRKAVRGDTLADVVRDGAETAEATLVFELGDYDYEVRRTYSVRTKAGSSGAEINRRRAGTEDPFEPLEAGNVGDVDAMILEVLGCDFTSFVLGSVMRQGDSDAFSSATPTERLDALAQILGVEHLRLGLDEARKRKRDLERDLEGMREQLERARTVSSDLEAARTKRAALETRAAALDVETRQRIVGELAAEIERFEQLVAEHDAAYRESREVLEQRDEVRAKIRDVEVAHLARVQDCTRLTNEKGDTQSAIVQLKRREAVDVEAVRARVGKLQKLLGDGREALSRVELLRVALKTSQATARRIDADLERIGTPWRRFVDEGAAVTLADLVKYTARLEERAEQLANVRHDLDELRDEAIKLERLSRDLAHEHATSVQNLERQAAALGKRPDECDMNHCGLIRHAVEAKQRLEKLANEPPRGQAEAKQAEAVRARMRELCEPLGIDPNNPSAGEAMLELQNERDAAHRAIEALERRDELRLELAAAHEAIDNAKEQLEGVEVVLEHVCDELFADVHTEHGDSPWREDLERVGITAPGILSGVEGVIEDLQSSLAGALDSSARDVQLATLNEKHERLTREIDEAYADVERLRAEHDKLEPEYKRLDERYTEITKALELVDSYRTNLAGLRSSHREARARLDEVRDEVRKVEGEVASLSSHIATLEERARALEETRERAERARADLARLEYAVEFFKVAPSIVIASAVPRLEHDANSVLEQIAPGFRLAIERQRLTRSGTARDEINLRVYVEGGERAVSLLSGGERFRVDIALRLALAEAAAGRASGKPLETLLIDEGWGSLDKAGVADLKDAIQRLRDRFPRMYVVTHVDAVFDLFGETIELSRQGGAVTVTR